ncbi:MAG TPA: triose-phosphate isomerase, partial [Kofleriaceae bacterium]|nr:triose-phosphate isomerase [Kofleriaceae bacterium]
MRTPFVVGNWKLHKTISESLALVTELKNQLGAIKGVAIGVAPVFTALSAVARRLEGSPIATCAQDCHWEASGAWTGEVSAAHAGDAGASWVIVGHSERRQFFGETSEIVGKKARAVLAAGLGAIVCVGESLADRDAGRTLSVVDDQLAAALAGVDTSSVARLVIAYEPVWANGTGRTASPAQAQ